MGKLLSPDGVVAFPGRSGTANMKATAGELGIPIKEIAW
jgi:hypothetical protein